MSNIDTFSAVHASGLLIPDPSSVTTLSLLFDKIYLPANIEAVKSFSKQYRFVSLQEKKIKTLITLDGRETDPFFDLTDSQKATAHRYLERSVAFSMLNSKLFGEVFITNAFEDNEPLKADLIKRGGPGELNQYRVGPQVLQLTEGDDEFFPNLIDKGYIPIVTSNIHISRSKLDSYTTKQLTSLLAMKSVEMLFPRTQAAHPETILEAREKLRDHLPPFWSSMFKISSDLRKLYAEHSQDSTVYIEAENLIDATVRPALIDLKRKLELERKQWFYRILSPIQKGLRLMIGNPPITPQQLITNAMVLASETAMSTVNHLKTIETLKESSGLIYLLELDKLVEQGPQRES